MKRTFFLLLLVTVAGMAAARETVPASDSRITYVGRTLTRDGAVSFDWSGVYARIAFTGGYLALEASDTGRDYFNVWIDREPSAEPDRVVTVASDTTVVLCDVRERRPRPHTLVIQKRTEGEQGRATFRSLTVEGTLLQAEPLRKRIIEFVGDSYTCGYGADSPDRSDPFRPEEENPAKTYADILCRYFGADGICIAHSGQGIARNYNDAGRGWHMPDRYLLTFDMDRDVAWDAAGVKPSLTVIYLGTNDFSTQRQPSFHEFRQHYQRLLESIKERYGADHPVLCVASKHDFVCHQYIRDVVQGCGMEQVFFAALTGGVHNDTSDLGAAWHPNYQGHLKKAYALLPYVATLTGWPLENKIVE